jgi:hypothetical protein
MPEYLIGSIVTASAVILTVVVTFVLEEFRRKREFTRMILHEAYQKRLALYEEVIEELSAMIKPERELLSMSLADFEDKILEFHHRLVTFLGRLSIYGSPRSRNVFALLSSKLLIQQRTIPRKDSAENFDFIRFTRGIVEESLVEFVKAVREETGVDFLNEEVVDYSGKSLKKAQVKAI